MHSPAVCIILKSRAVYQTQKDDLAWLVRHGALFSPHLQLEIRDGSAQYRRVQRKHCAPHLNVQEWQIEKHAALETKQYCLRFSSLTALCLLQTGSVPPACMENV